jgi:archaellum biogenesis ATPase FlaH
MTIETRWQSGQIVTSEELSVLVATASEEAERLWGPFLYRSALVLLNAASGTGKTVLCKRLARALALGEPFLGYAPTKPLQVLYVELESPSVVLKHQLTAIPPVPGLDFVRATAGTLLGVLADQAKSYDVVIVDPLMLAVPVHDEDNNALANGQMSHFIALKAKHGTTFILVHNMGLEAGRARGATARKDRADLEWQLTRKGAAGLLLKLTKDRLHNNKVALELSFTGVLDYKVVSSSAPVAEKPQTIHATILDWKALHPGPQKTAVLAAYLGVEKLTQTHYEPIEKLKAQGYLDPESPKGWLHDGPLLMEAPTP